MYLFQNHPLQFTDEQIKKQICEIIAQSKDLLTTENLHNIIGLLDYTSLNVTDTDKRILAMCKSVNMFPERYFNFPNVAAICIYPAFVELVKKNLTTENVSIASVAAGFPASQTPMEVKKCEILLAQKHGATELDIVISVGKFLSADYESVYNEFVEMKQVCDLPYKVILETGALETPENVWNASMLMLEAGANFIKTSTGKLPVGATHQSVFVMCQAIKLYYELTGKKIGLKPAGGISTPQQAVEYYAIVKNILGDEWLKPSLFRIGASSLANNICSYIETQRKGNPVYCYYFE